MDAVKFIEERNRMCGTMSEVWGVDAAQIVKNTEEWPHTHAKRGRVCFWSSTRRRKLTNVGT